jgi:hypothetical protein
LHKTGDGKGLVFEQSNIVTKNMITGVTREVKQSDLPQDRRIVKGKKIFAESIAPTLDVAEFEAFKLIFEKIDAVLKSLK